MIAGLVLAGIAGVVAFTTLSQAAPQIQQSLGEDAPVVNVVVAARTVTVRSALTAEDIELKAVPAAAVPDGAIYELEAALGQL
ncbi:MAG: hypothetical protein KDE47_34495, partial [Caldilineaceae bacterium]|nr:hypothetical protein [Caldilineaceae bacterium]